LKKEYIYGASGLVATIDPTNGTRYTTADHLGSPRVVTSSTGAVVSRYDYKPFGRELVASDAGRTSAQGFGGGDGLRQKFTGKERDDETGLDFFGARYYASIQGRFTSVDPVMIKKARLLDPQRINLYASVRNNPLKYIDPDGADLILAENLKPKQREFIVKNLARLYMTEKGRAIIERVDKSPFVVAIGRSELTRKEINPARPGETKIGGSEQVVGAVTRYDSTTDPKTKQKTLIANGSKETEMLNPISVLVDKDNSSDMGKDPATVMAHELGGHTTDLLNLAERPMPFVGTPGFDITGYDDEDETSSEKAEKVDDLPDKPTDEAIQAIEEKSKKRERQ
jgi:RHS repeat-associated protein